MRYLIVFTFDCSHREELDKYWQQIISIDKITEFNKHHCSQEIKEFLNFDTVTKKTKVRGNRDFNIVSMYFLLDV